MLISICFTFGVVFRAVGGVVLVQDGVVVLYRVLLAAVEAVVLAEELVVSQGELLTGDQLLFAGRTSEALEVEDLVLGAHHVVGLSERAETLVALGAEQPGETHERR